MPITRSQIKLDGNDFVIRLHFHRVLYVGLNRYGENRILIDVQFFSNISRDVGELTFKNSCCC